MGETGRVEPGRPEITDAVEAGAWIRERLHPFAAHDVGALVPEGFAAYVRIDHPGRSGGPPDAGLSALISVLGAHTAAPRECLLCLWAGYGWLRPGRNFSGVYTRRGRLGSLGRIAAARARRREERTLGAALPEHLEERARLKLPAREYLVFRGPLEAVRAFRRDEPHGMWNDGPNLWWPEDRAWLVASDVDLDHTYVAGSRDLSAALLVEEAWTAQSVELDDPLVR